MNVTSPRDRSDSRGSVRSAADGLCRAGRTEVRCQWSGVLQHGGGFLTRPRIETIEVVQDGVDPWRELAGRDIRDVNRERPRTRIFMAITGRFSRRYGHGVG